MNKPDPSPQTPAQVSPKCKKNMLQANHNGKYKALHAFLFFRGVPVFFPSANAKGLNGPLPYVGVQDVGSWIQDTESWTQDPEHRILDPGLLKQNGTDLLEHLIVWNGTEQLCLERVISGTKQDFVRDFVRGVTF